MKTWGNGRAASCIAWPFWWMAKRCRPSTWAGRGSPGDQVGERVWYEDGTRGDGRNRLPATPYRLSNGRIRLRTWHHSGDTGLLGIAHFLGGWCYGAVARGICCETLGRGDVAWEVWLEGGVMWHKELGREQGCLAMVPEEDVRRAVVYEGHDGWRPGLFGLRVLRRDVVDFEGARHNAVSFKWDVELDRVMRTIPDSNPHFEETSDGRVFAWTANERNQEGQWYQITDIPVGAAVRHSLQQP